MATVDDSVEEKKKTKMQRAPSCGKPKKVKPKKVKSSCGKPKKSKPKKKKKSSSCGKSKKPKPKKKKSSCGKSKKSKAKKKKSKPKKKKSSSCSKGKKSKPKKKKKSKPKKGKDDDDCGGPIDENYEYKKRKPKKKKSKKKSSCGKSKKKSNPKPKKASCSKSKKKKSKKAKKKCQGMVQVKAYKRCCPKPKKSKKKKSKSKKKASKKNKMCSITPGIRDWGKTTSFLNCLLPDIQRFHIDTSSSKASIGSQQSSGLIESTEPRHFELPHSDCNYYSSNDKVADYVSSSQNSAKRKHSNNSNCSSINTTRKPKISDSVESNGLPEIAIDSQSSSGIDLSNNEAGDMIPSQSYTYSIHGRSYNGQDLDSLIKHKKDSQKKPNQRACSKKKV